MEEKHKGIRISACFKIFGKQVLHNMMYILILTFRIAGHSKKLNFIDPEYTGFRELNILEKIVVITIHFLVIGIIILFLVMIFIDPGNTIE